MVISAENGKVRKCRLRTRYY